MNIILNIFTHLCIFVVKLFNYKLKRKVIYFIRHNMEAFIWISALFLLAIHSPAEHHYSFCPFKNLGWEFCPGCGLGRSISYLFRGELGHSLQCHPLGIFAMLVLTLRIFMVFKQTNNQIKIIFK